ncbi:MAG TPA: sulfate transporter CysZ [Gammaproteobacteria bacterium]|nr:sulfate transporter CysZ [Gammaproteobacteria bacterium]
MQNTTNGFYYLIEGFKLLGKPGLKRYVIIPLAINIILFIGFFFIARHFFGEFDQWLLRYLPSWLRWLGSILWITFFIGFTLIFIYTFVAITNLISAPFNSFLAEKIEFYLTGKIAPERTLLENIKDIPRILARQFSLIGYYLPRALVLLIFFFVPIVQIIAALLWFVFNAWFMTLQYLDYPTDNHKIALANVHVWLWNNRLLSLSFGGGVLIATMVPVLNFFIVPAAVAGATKLWVEAGE